MLIVDSSAVAAFLFDEPDAEQMGLAMRGRRLAAPEWLMVEVGNVCRTKSRREPDAASRLAIAYSARGALDIVLHDIDLDAVLAVALQTGLSFYDASYLWLARELGAELLTLDKRLAAAARA